MAGRDTSMIAATHVEVAGCQKTNKQRNKQKQTSHNQQQQQTTENRTKHFSKRSKRRERKKPHPKQEPPIHYTVYLYLCENVYNAYNVYNYANIVYRELALSFSICLFAAHFETRGPTCLPRRLSTVLGSSSTIFYHSESPHIRQSLVSNQIIYKVQICSRPMWIAAWGRHYL